MNCMTMKYQALEQVSYDEALMLLKSGDADQCLMLSLRAGEYIGDWKQAEDTCLRCCESRDPALRANEVLGLSYVHEDSGSLTGLLLNRIFLRN